MADPAKRWSTKKKAWTYKPKHKYVKKGNTGITNFSLFQAPAKQIETKYADTLASFAASTTGSVTLLNNIAGGDTEQNRTGIRINITSVQVRLQVRPGTDSTQDAVRVMVVYDRQALVGAPTFTPATVLTSADPYAMNSRVNTTRFIKLMDEFVGYTYANTGVWPIFTGSPFVIEKYVKCTLPATYNSNTGTDINNGAVYLMILGTVAAGAGAATVYGSARLRFTDA